jgi:hypothetical protein
VSDRTLAPSPAAAAVSLLSLSFSKIGKRVLRKSL